MVTARIEFKEQYAEDFLEGSNQLVTEMQFETPEALIATLQGIEEFICSVVALVNADNQQDCQVIVLQPSAAD